MRQPLKLSLAFALSLTWTVGADAAFADKIVSGYIVRIEAKEIYFNISTRDGLNRGSSLRIKRPIKLRHPVSGKQITDWLPIGRAQVTMAGGTLGMARIEDGLLAQVAVGDIVETLVLEDTLEPEPPPTPTPPSPPPSTEPIKLGPLPELDAHTRQVLTLWQSTSGATVEVRIGAWEDFLARFPDSRYAAAIHEDLEVLRAHRDKLNPPELDLEDSFTGGLRHNPPTRGRAGEALDLAFLVEEVDLAAAWIHYRVRGSSSYSKGVLTRDGDDYLRGEIPGSAVRGPGLEYFVEIATNRGRVGTAVGTPDSPVRIDVPSPPITNVFRERKNRSRVTLTSEYLNFATFDTRDGERTDAYFLFEADFLYRLRGALYGIRTGLGVINGSGGFADLMYDASNPAEKAGFNYGYAEVELRAKRGFAALLRIVAGVGREGFGLGFEGRARLGVEDGTNLSFGLSRIAEIGFLTELRMQWNAVQNVPLGLAVALTDQPNQGDLGVRLTADIGYRALSWVQPTIRISYQGRTVQHTGLGAGLGLVFDW